MRIWIYVETARTIFTDAVSNAVDHCEENDENKDDGSDSGGKRTSGCGVRSWRRILLLLVTNKFHFKVT